MKALMQRIGYPFANEELLTLALTHPSLGKAGNNQRLEFLGDAVLGLVVAEMLYALYPGEQEGELARRHAALVRAETIVQVAQQLDIGAAMKLSASEAGLGGRSSASNLEDALEALIGAIYLDGGFDAAKNFILPLWQEAAANTTSPPKDAKTSLQEWAQARGLPVPTYTVTERSGPAHAPTFKVEVSVQGHAPEHATGPSKRAAEQLAAGSLLALLLA